MDIHSELAAVVFDEVHYINDPGRGNVWEQSIMMLPQQVQMVMLSATIDKPEKFATWCESIEKGQVKDYKKQVYLASNSKRAVPLSHYAFVTTNTGLFKAVKDKQIQEEIKQTTNRPLLLQSAEGVFQDATYHRVQKTLQLLKKHQVEVKRPHVLNQLTKHLVSENMLPALCFVFSKKQLELCAREVTTILLEDDSKVPYIVRRESEKILRKLPDFQEYLDLKEYQELTALLEKGIGIHHAGMLGPLRELVEMLFSQGFIKLLFCTETLSIGINMPVKTTIFTDITKFDGRNQRLLHAHEYTQAAGRAGRLGLDKVGHVIHLNNLFRRPENISITSYKDMMNGKPQTLVSKFQISYSFLLNRIDIGDMDFSSFAKRSMIQQSIDNQIREYKTQLEKAATEEEREYIKDDIFYAETYIDRQTGIVLRMLDEEGFIEKIQDGTQDETQSKIVLTPKGKMATQIKEVPCLVFGEMIYRKDIEDLNSLELAQLLSCFTSVSTPEDKRTNVVPKHVTPLFQKVIEEAKKNNEKWENKESKEGIHMEIENKEAMHYELLEGIRKWYGSETNKETMKTLEELEREKGISVGEFSKAMMKIIAMTKELTKVYESESNESMKKKLIEIEKNVSKSFMRNVSLYM
jgi:superfamily II RNA helicase